MDAYPGTGQPARRTTIALQDLPGPRGLPFLGNATQVRSAQMHRQLEAWSRLHGSRYRIRLGGRRMLVCADPDDIAAILKDRPNGFRRSTRLEMVGRELEMAGVFGANGDDWRRQRAFVMHAFNPAHVKSYFPSLHIVGSRLMQRWDGLAAGSASFDLEPDLMRYTVDVTAGLAFGADINTIESEGKVLQGHLGTIFHPARLQQEERGEDHQRAGEADDVVPDEVHHSLCRTASNNATPVATDTLRLSSSPGIGIFTNWSQCSRVRRRRPSASPPSTRATLPLKSIE